MGFAEICDQIGYKLPKLNEALQRFPKNVSKSIQTSKPLDPSKDKICLILHLIRVTSTLKDLGFGNMSGKNIHELKGRI